jgi:hypothetical protein
MLNNNKEKKKIYFAKKPLSFIDKSDLIVERIFTQ